ncbi:hypothetical protein LOK49_LG13G02354 [Camellia lanceoleosa]|uniref:Uncharacterized protein n=1 Tax=Camellia lanceoleosa TaxID=1840588 RepID=A0ACC0FJS3_9ERIC|nr:hypothetical protein LOK49_LG13G02354 [Camellia lanceoleosa]
MQEIAARVSHAPNTTPPGRASHVLRYKKPARARVSHIPRYNTPRAALHANFVGSFCRFYSSTKSLNIDLSDEESKRLLFNRGFLELDLILGKWVEDHINSMDENGIKSLVDVLDLMHTFAQTCSYLHINGFCHIEDFAIKAANSFAYWLTDLEQPPKTINTNPARQIIFFSPILVFSALREKVLNNLKNHAAPETRATPRQPWLRGWDDFKKGRNFFNWNKVKIRYCDGASFAGHPENMLPSCNDQKDNDGAIPKDHDGIISAFSNTEFSSPLQVTPIFRSLAAGIPSPKFSESCKALYCQSSSLLEAIDLILQGAQNLVVPIKSNSRRKQQESPIAHNGCEFC